jgi:hypothetical protein
LKKIETLVDKMKGLMDEKEVATKITTPKKGY